MYNGNFSYSNIPFSNDRFKGQTGRRIFTCDGLNDAVSLKGVPFSE